MSQSGPGGDTSQSGPGGDTSQSGPGGAETCHSQVQVETHHSQVQVQVQYGSLSRGACGVCILKRAAARWSLHCSDLNHVPRNLGASANRGRAGDLGFIH
ncbi:hypothetical protein WMY93_031319 [Mugilogobius chulae]|uniref:Uncharacterized protein n=1 Tax=Mugilogobius chulae TaxID=88201 RepID=A0AAW0MID5_9GOBI